MKRRLLEGRKAYATVYSHNYADYSFMEEKRPEANKEEVLLKVDHLSQYFKLGHFDLKAVNNVSFDIKKGEVFGLVGESGCGKTTTGRSIIKLYNITGGDVYFKGERISAGLLEYKKALKSARDAYEQGLIDAKEYQAIADENNALIRKAKKDVKHYNSTFIKDEKERIIAKYDK